MQQYNGSLAKRLVLSIGIWLGALIGVAIFSSFYLKSHISHLKDGILAAEQIGAMSGDFKTQVQEWKNVLLRGQDAEARNKYWSAFKDKAETVQKDGRALAEFFDEQGQTDHAKTVRDFLSEHKTMLGKYEQGFAAFEQSQFDAKAGDAAVKGVDRAAGEALSQLNKEVAEHYAEASKSADTATFISVSIVIVAGIAVIWMLRLTLQNQVNLRTEALRRYMERMANGDFSERVHINGDDEIAAVMGGMEQVRDFVARVATDINATSTEIGSVAGAMSRSSQQLSSVVHDSEGRIHQAATALNEMTSTVNDIARSAANASQVTDTVNRSASDALSQMERNTATSRQLADEMNKAADIVQRLRDETKNIGTVLEVIKGIAEQTNLLALNAAIEAARAGEQGRGFAVVADEVRNLAQRTQESTSEIQQIIQNVQSGASSAATAMEQGNSRTRESAEQAEQARAALAEITGAVANIRDMNAQIATAAEEQSATVEEINRNVVGVSNSAKSTNEHAQQSLSTANQLNNVAGKLHDLVLRVRC